MSMQIAGKQVKFYLETQEGVVFDMTGMVGRVDIHTKVDQIDFTSPMDEVPVFIPGTERTTVSLDIVGSGAWRLLSDMAQEVRAKATAAEWKCDYCGRPNSRKDETCKSCGAARSFLYG